MIPREKNSRGSNNVTNLDEVRKAKALAESATADALADHQADADDSDVNDSSVEQSHADRHGNRRFDAEKVARIKAAIAAGEYKINPSRVADKFIEHDRNQ